MKIKLFLFALTVTFFGWSCSQSPKCWGGSKNKGIIVSPLDVTSCLIVLEPKTFVIDSQEELDSLLFLSEQIGFNCSMPVVDFLTYTVLAQYADGQCEVDFIREVVKDTDQQQYIYTVEVKECGICKKMAQSMNGVLVPKLPEGWTVRFVLK